MNVTHRSYLTAGVAALSVGAIALSPVQPLPANVALAPERAVSTMAVELAAAIDPFTPIIEAIKASVDNVRGLITDWVNGIYVDGIIPAPPNTILNGNFGNRAGGYETGNAFPILQQFLSNQITYLQELPNVGVIVQQIFGNVVNAIKAPFKVGETKPGTNLGIPGQYNQNVNGVVFSTPIPGLDINQRAVGALLPILAGDSYAALEPILNFATTPISGVLLGAVGPVLGPVLSVLDDVRAAFTALRESNFAAAINSLINIPTNAINAALNGGPVLDLTNIVGGLLPASVKTLGLKMGGLLSPGGVAFDGIAAEADATIGQATLQLKVPGNPVGPVGALVGLTNYVAQSIKVQLPQQASARAAAAVEVEAPAAPAPEVEEAAPTVADVEAVADEAPATKRQNRATTRADKANGSEKASRAGRGARNAS